MARTMKDSGVEWIGTIPEDWETIKIKYTSWLKGRIGWQGLKSNEYQEVGAHLITGVDFMDGTINWDSCVRISEKRFNEAPEIHIKEGDLLITKDGTIGKVAIAKNCPQQVSLNSGVLLIRNTKDFKYYDKYLYYVLLSDEFWTWYEMSQTGNSTIRHLYQEQFYNFEFTFPRMEEQKKIAHFLDNKVGKIDAIISKTKESIEEYKRYRNSVISEKIILGMDSSVPIKNSGVDWCPQIPEHWNVINPKALFALRKEKAKEGDRQLTASQKKGIMYQDEYMEAEGVRVVVVQKDFDILKHVEPDDFVISMRSFQGGLEYSELSGCISSAYVMLIPNKEKVYSPFYKWFFKSSKYINAIQSTSNLVRDGQAMRYSNFAQVPLLDIPLEEQKEIAEYLTEKCGEIDVLIEKKEAFVEEMESYKKSLIYEYVIGKKEVL